jgi:serine/threonine-protein kinase
VSVRRSCALTGISPATYYRRVRPLGPRHGPWLPRTPPPQALTPAERSRVLDLLNSPTYQDLAIPYEGRVHSLWYCDGQEKGRYQWFETAFVVRAFIPKRGRKNPFALNPGEQSAKALWNGIAEWQVAWPFTLLNIGDLDEFVNRWAGWFANAAQGQLSHPSSMPERSPQGSWRRS